MENVEVVPWMRYGMDNSAYVKSNIIGLKGFVENVQNLLLSMVQNANVNLASSRS